MCGMALWVTVHVFVFLVVMVVFYLGLGVICPGTRW